MTDPRVRAEDLLRRAASLCRTLEEHKARYETEGRQAKKRFQELVQPTAARLKETEKEIEALGLGHQEELFGKPTKEQAAEGVRCTLAAGSLILTVRDVVRRARSVTVEALKGLGWLEGVRREESVDWQKVETWPDERLAALGTERKEKVEIGWEIP